MNRQQTIVPEPQEDWESELEAEFFDTVEPQPERLERPVVHASPEEDLEVIQVVPRWVWPSIAGMALVAVAGVSFGLGIAWSTTTQPSGEPPGPVLEPVVLTEADLVEPPTEPVERPVHKASKRSTRKASPVRAKRAAPAQKTVAPERPAASPPEQKRAQVDPARLVPAPPAAAPVPKATPSASPAAPPAQVPVEPAANEAPLSPSALPKALSLGSVEPGSAL